MDAFTRGYIECALWAASAGVDIADDGTVTENHDNDMSFEEHNFGVDDIAPDSLACLIEECAEFQRANERLLAIATQQIPGRTDAQHGHDFWLTRNGHGCGFWDRGYRFGIGDALTAAAEHAGCRNMMYSEGRICHE